MPFDSGKTLLLDKIRGTAVQMREAGGMTQQIGASFFPLDTLVGICRSIMKEFRTEIKIPGLLVIDTPGHEAFANLRRRGGSVADMAALVIDITRGFEPQTHESLDILVTRKTPFIVLANKVDLVPGWTTLHGSSFLDTYAKQDTVVRDSFDTKMYQVMNTFSLKGIRADRFDKIRDFTRNAAIVPVSAKTGEGLPEFIAVLIGLAQQYLLGKLEVGLGAARGTVLEVKEETGMGVTLNTIIYEGILRQEDMIVVGGKTAPIKTRVKALLMPQPLDEIRDPRKRFASVQHVSAAAGVKIVASGLEDAVAGAPLSAATEESDVSRLAGEIVSEMNTVRIATDRTGIVLKTDTLGSLEAMTESLRSRGVPIRLADFGDISRRDVMEAVAVKHHDPLYSVVLGFNVKLLQDAEMEADSQGIRIFRGDIIYNVMDEYVSWLEAERGSAERREFEALAKPGKLLVLRGYFFRNSKPAIFGIRVVAGSLSSGAEIVSSDGSALGKAAQIQDTGKSVSLVAEGKEVAISMPRVILDRNVKEDDILYVDVPQQHAKALLKRHTSRMNKLELETLQELVTIRRRKDPIWAV